MKILITGGAGFIGSHLVERLQKDHQILVIDNLSTGKRENLSPHIKLEVLDIRSEEARILIRQFSPQVIIHLAAISSVQYSMDHTLDAHSVNLSATIALIDLASQIKARFIFASSAAVYGDDPTLPKDERESTTLPISFYGVDKFAAERYLLNFAKHKNLEGVAFRFFNVFGPRQDPTSPYSGVLSIFLNAFLQQDQPELVIYGDGLQTRDFIYVKDVVEALTAGAEGRLMTGECYNVARAEEHSLLSLVKQLEEITGKKALLHYKQARPSDIRFSRANMNKLHKQGVVAHTTVCEGLKLTLTTL